MFFHGCGESAASYYDGFGFLGSYTPRATGLIEHAAANGIVVIFPQNKMKDIPFFDDCWEMAWKDERSHPQMDAIRQISRAFYGYDLFTENENGESAIPEDTSSGNSTEGSSASNETSTSEEESQAGNEVEEVEEEAGEDPVSTISDTVIQEEEKIADMERTTFIILCVVAGVLLLLIVGICLCCMLRNSSSNIGIGPVEMSNEKAMEIAYQYGTDNSMKIEDLNGDNTSQQYG